MAARRIAPATQSELASTGLVTFFSVKPGSTFRKRLYSLVAMVLESAWVADGPTTSTAPTTRPYWKVTMERSAPRPLPFDVGE